MVLLGVSSSAPETTDWCGLAGKILSLKPKTSTEFAFGHYSGQAG